MAGITEPIAPEHQEETRSAVERIGTFAAAARPEHLTTDIRQLFKRNILDSIACAIAAVAGPSLRLLRDQIEEYRAPGRCTLIGGGKTSPDQAALFNSALVRYVDLLDTYMAQGGLCHPSDNFGTILAAAEYVGASGEEFMLALAAAYEIQCRFTASVPVMAKGFNHAIQLAISAAAGAGRLFGLSVNELANAVAIATHRKECPVKHPTFYKTIQVDGLSIFYREAGPKDAPTLLLLHGLPSSSRMFEPLFSRLSDRYHLVAPDYPGFGHSDWPEPKAFAYTFDHYADIMNHFTEALGLSRYTLYMQDYGGPWVFAWPWRTRSGSRL